MNKTILLLGASNNAKGELSQMAIDRLECAYAVYSNNSNVNFICTGGFGEPEMTREYFELTPKEKS